MKTDFQFSNLCGTVYKQGNVLFTGDGNQLISPVGNRVTIFNLVENQSSTLPFETETNIVCIALSPKGNLLFVADEVGKGLLVHLSRRFILHRFNFKGRIRDLKFSPDGKLFAYALDKKIFVWKTPGAHRELTPFVKVRELFGHFDDVTSLCWNQDSRTILSSSKDMTCKIFSVYPEPLEKPQTLSGHKSAVQGVFYSQDHNIIYSVSLDGQCYEWQFTTLRTILSEREDQDLGHDLEGAHLDTERWLFVRKNYFEQPGSKVIKAAFHPSTNLLLVGFSKGTFGIWELPDFINIHTLSISQTKIDTVSINSTGEWLALGTSKFGQLLVWEWQSESYILKQQGHYYELNTLAYSPDAQHIATGGQDGKVKLWNTVSGFCFVTFSEHSGPVTAIEFTKNGQVVVSASRDGTVRAFDLLRYRNFRTFTTPEPVQFSSLAVDPSGDLICAGSVDTFEVFVWSMQTGKLLEVLSGHTGPISSMAFSPTENFVATGSWDGTVRIWDAFGRTQAVELLQINNTVLALAYRPDGNQLAVASLNGQISFFNPKDGSQVGSVEGRNDISGPRLSTDRVSSSAHGKSFNSLCYSADGSCIIGGGDSMYVCIYDTKTSVLVRKLAVSRNQSLDGTQRGLSKSHKTEAGPLSLIDDADDDPSVAMKHGRDALPGVRSGDLSVRRTRPEVRTTAVRFAPTGRAWAAASTEGLLIFSQDESLRFDPVDLDIEITPDSLQSTLDQNDHLKALIMACRLNEKPWLRKTLEHVPPGDIDLVVRNLPNRYLPILLSFLAYYAENQPRHVEFLMLWIHHLLVNHAPRLKQNIQPSLPPLRALRKVVGKWHSELGSMCDANLYLSKYLTRKITSTSDQSCVGSVDDAMDVGLEHGFDSDIDDVASSDSSMI